MHVTHSQPSNWAREEATRWAAHRGRMGRGLGGVGPIRGYWSAMADVRRSTRRSGGGGSCVAFQDCSVASLRVWPPMSEGASCPGDCGQASEWKAAEARLGAVLPSLGNQPRAHTAPLLVAPSAPGWFLRSGFFGTHTSVLWPPVSVLRQGNGRRVTCYQGPLLPCLPPVLTPLGKTFSLVTPSA